MSMTHEAVKNALWWAGYAAVLIFATIAVGRFTDRLSDTDEGFLFLPMTIVVAVASYYSYIAGIKNRTDVKDKE